MRQFFLHHAPGTPTLTKKLKSMLTPSKKSKLFNALKGYKKKYLDQDISELDESGTRIMINTFLTDVLG